LDSTLKARLVTHPDKLSAVIQLANEKTPQVENFREISADKRPNTIVKPSDILQEPLEAIALKLFHCSMSSLREEKKNDVKIAFL
jgi:hypothetical protein